MFRRILALTVILGFCANASVAFAQATDGLSYADTLRKSGKSHVVAVKGKSKASTGKHAGHAKSGAGKKKHTV